MIQSQEEKGSKSRHNKRALPTNYINTDVTPLRKTTSLYAKDKTGRTVRSHYFFLVVIRAGRGCPTLRRLR